MISIDYDKAIELASQLNVAAQMCDESLTRLKVEQRESERFWQGLSGNAMRGQLNKAERELKIQKGQLETIAANIRRVADELKNADERLVGIINIFR